ncbi:hypothetical protein [Klebsiella phage pKV-BS375-3.1]|nr:hypothetical protein [Klebsiella phage pKV-BS375-3.1]
MSLLKLNVGDRVRNINLRSSRRGWIGIVVDFGNNENISKPTYEVEWSNGELQGYVQCYAHNYLERLGGEQPPQRKVLRRERVNVITGMTQSQMVRELGPARGVVEFNTRALGRSTGQALHAIGSAMTNPGTEIRISGIDHFLESDEHRSERGRVNRHQVDQHFRALVQSLVGDMKGFSFTATHITFNPIVTEEVYVE